MKLWLRVYYAPATFLTLIPIVIAKWLSDRGTYLKSGALSTCMSVLISILFIKIESPIIFDRICINAPPSRGLTRSIQLRANQSSFFETTKKFPVKLGRLIVDRTSTLLPKHKLTSKTHHQDCDSLNEEHIHIEGCSLQQIVTAVTFHTRTLV